MTWLLLTTPKLKETYTKNKCFKITVLFVDFKLTNLRHCEVTKRLASETPSTVLTIEQQKLIIIIQMS